MEVNFRGQPSIDLIALDVIFRRMVRQFPFPAEFALDTLAAVALLTALFAAAVVRRVFFFIPNFVILSTGYTGAILFAARPRLFLRFRHC